MAYKSLLLSLTLTIVLGYCLTVGLTSPNSLIKKMPDWASILLLIVLFVLYLVAAWWGFKGFGEHKLTALLSLGLCTLGLGLYLIGFVMEKKNTSPKSKRCFMFFNASGVLVPNPIAP